MALRKTRTRQKPKSKAKRKGKPKQKKRSVKKSILDKVQPIEQLPDVITAVFYGRSGTGKTTLLGTFPKPLLVLDISEKGTDSIASVKGVNVLHVETWDDIESLYWEVKEDPSLFKTIGIDALHSMQTLAITEAKRRNNIKPEESTSQRIFGEASGLMQQWLQSFRDLSEDGIHIVYLAHDKVFATETEDGTQDTIAPEVGPKVMPSLSSYAMGIVNIVGQTYIAETVTRAKKAGRKAKREINYRLRLGAHSFYSTKIRKSKDIELPEFINDPSYDKITRLRKGLSETPTKKAKAKVKAKTKAKRKR